MGADEREGVWLKCQGKKLMATEKSQPFHKTKADHLRGRFPGETETAVEADDDASFVVAMDSTSFAVALDSTPLRLAMSVASSTMCHVLDCGC